MVEERFCESICSSNGFEEIEAITVVDVLRRAEIDVETVSITENLWVTGAHGIGLKPIS